MPENYTIYSMDTGYKHAGMTVSLFSFSLLYSLLSHPKGICRFARAGLLADNLKVSDRSLSVLRVLYPYRLARITPGLFCNLSVRI